MLQRQRDAYTEPLNAFDRLVAAGPRTEALGDQFLSAERVYGGAVPLIGDSPK